LTVAVLYDHAKLAFEKDVPARQSLVEVFRANTLGYVILNVGALALSTYYIVTSGDSGAATGGLDWGRLAWFGAAIFVAIVLPLAALVPADWLAAKD
jgi:hypothetical protein